MADTPTPAPQAAPTDAPPQVNAPAAPAPPIPNTGSTQDATMAQIAPLEANANAANQKIVQLANAGSAPPKPVPHARLLAIVNGIATGLSAFGDSIATHGQDGGAKEVTQIRGEEQAQRIAAQQAATAQRNAQIQQQQTVADTNHKMAQNLFLLATMPDELTKSDMSAKAAELGVSGAQQEQAIGQANFRAEHGGKSADDFNKAMADPNPVAGSPQSPNNLFKINADQAIKAAKQAGLPASDLYVQNLQKVLDDPNATAKALYVATYQLASQQKMQSTATDEKNKRDAADPLYKLETDPSSMEGAKASAAIPLLNNMLQSETDPTKKSRETRLLAQAQNAHANYLADQQSQEKAKMIAQAGDPKQAGQALAEGDVTLADLKSRGSTPGQIVEATNEAKKYAAAHGYAYNAADEITGEQVLKGQTTQTFFGSARSLVQQGGMLDQLKEAHNNLGNQQIPAFNKIADWVAFQAGTPELAAYKQAVLAAADDYAKVMGGGSPNLEQFNSLRDGFANQLNNKQMDAAIDVARNSVRSQVTGRIGTNRYIAQREGDILRDDTPKTFKASDYPRPAGIPAGAKLMVVPGGVPHWMTTPEQIAAAVKANATEVQ